MYSQTEKTSSSLRRSPWRRYVLCVADGCSRHGDGEHAVAECRVPGQAGRAYESSKLQVQCVMFIGLLRFIT